MKDILVCLSASSHNPKVISAAADMMQDSNRKLTAIYVETSAFHTMSETEKNRLNKHIQDAEQLGAEVEIVKGENVAFAIADYAKHAGIETIVIGQSDTKTNRILPHESIPEELFRYMPDAEIHIIPDSWKRNHLAAIKRPGGRRGVILDMLLTAAMLVAATAIGMLFDRMDFSSSNIMMVYLLAVLLISVITSSRQYSFVVPVICVVLFNYFFVQPKFSLATIEPGYTVSFAVLFVTSLIAGNLAMRLKQTANQSVETAWRTKVISETDQLLAKAGSRAEILSIMASQCGQLLGEGVVAAGIHKGDAEGLSVYPEEDDPELSEKERNMIKQFLENDGEDDLSDYYRRCFAARTQERIHAVLVIRESVKWDDPSERSLLLTVLGECALAFDNERNARKEREARDLAENERRRTDILRSISHDLRTPLTSISGNAGALIDGADRFDEETRQSMYEAIYEDSVWLTDLVENLMASTRLESDVKLRVSVELAEDIIREAASHLRPHDGRRIIIDPVPELILIRVDARLIIQVIINLAGNALKYTYPGAEIHISAEKKDDMAQISVSDNGPGIPEEDKDKIFNMFYIGKEHQSDSRKSLGLGLSLVRTIVEAHGGTATVEDNVPKGTVFSFTVPSVEVPEDE